MLSTILLTAVNLAGTTQTAAVTTQGTLTVGVDDTGYDVKFFGATSGKSLLWDESADSLIVTGTTTLVGTTNLDAVDIDGAVQLDATLNVGVNDTGYDVKFFGDTASAYMLWDTSADDLILGGGAGLIVPEGQFTLGSTAVTSTAAELNKLDGVTATTTELNYLDITTLGTSQASKAVTANASGDIIIPDSDKISFGAGSDLQIYHNGSNSYIDDTGTGNLYIRGSATVRLQSATGEQGVIVTTDGAVTLYHNNGAKIATTSTGIDVTGLVEFDSLSGTGGVAITDILDEDDMSSNSATKLATQQSIKAYVDAGGEGSAKAWLSYENQGTASIISSFNTASVSDDGTGDYTTTYTSAMADTTYNLVGMGGLGSTSLLVTMQPRGTTAPATASCRFTTAYVNGSTYDAPFTGSACLGDLA